MCKGKHEKNDKVPGIERLDSRLVGVAFENRKGDYSALG